MKLLYRAQVLTVFRNFVKFVVNLIERESILFDVVVVITELYSA